jgi:hypothetical protein
MRSSDRAPTRRIPATRTNPATAGATRAHGENDSGQIPIRPTAVIGALCMPQTMSTTDHATRPMEAPEIRNGRVRSTENDPTRRAAPIVPRVIVAPARMPLPTQEIPDPGRRREASSPVAAPATIPRIAAATVRRRSGAARVKCRSTGDNRRWWKSASSTANGPPFTPERIPAATAIATRRPTQAAPCERTQAISVTPIAASSTRPSAR